MAPSVMHAWRVSRLRALARANAAWGGTSMFKPGKVVMNAVTNEVTSVVISEVTNERH
jgi:hypothetical protein